MILSKPSDKEIANNDDNQVISLSKNELCFILPKNLSSYYVNNGLFEANLVDWCKQFCSKSKITLDIGAHTGTYGISLSKHSKEVYCFEPQKMTYYSLCGSIALSNIKNVTCINFGLGSLEQVGKQTLNIVSLDGGGSTLHTNNNNILQTEEIEVRTLDSFNIDNIGFIKIDVEENELQVLLSGENTLKRSNYPKILFEMNVENKDLINFLKGINYDIININGCNNMFLATNKYNV